MERIVLLSPNSHDFMKKLPSRQLIAKQFPDGEDYIRIPVDFRGKEVVLIHRCYPEQDKSLVQLFLILSTLKGEASRVRVVIPYLPYARQDKLFLKGEALSSKIICQLIKNSGCDELITFDCHFLKKPGRFTYGGLNIRNLSLSHAIISYFKGKLHSPKIISPDEGASYFLVSEKDAGVMKKERGAYSVGKSIYRKPSIEVHFDVRGRNVVIVDDIIGTGSTMLKAVEACRKLGASSISCGTSHGLFLNNSLKRLKRAGAKEVIASNSIKSPASRIDTSDSLRSVL
ncbi:ribose-phosphate diphosphokinase [Candidatus Micrarchaeota archaeon]|nr:ribose-phosphate diphosphokinase [Candidatus Micrarchaeota archaeon]